MSFRVNSAGRVDQGHFSKVPNKLAAPRSVFDRSFSHKTAVDAGLLYPVLWEPLLPGDTVNLTMNALARLATPVFPYMDNVYMDIHFFFVPNRLLWEHWENFQGARIPDPDSSVDYEVPQLSQVTHAAGFAENSIYDYFGLPTKEAFANQAIMPIALPLRAYNLIWNEWYRDENFQDSVPVLRTDAADTTAFTLLRRNRRKDYFTSGLPWPQKGPAVTLPFGGSAPVVGNDEVPLLKSATGVQADHPIWNNTTTAWGLGTWNTTQWNGPVYWGTESGLEADLSAVTSVTINDLRESFVLQQMLELDARGGTRYVEAILARFGVVSPDFRLQRPEYLGGQTLDVNVSPIAQTSATDAETPQGNLAGFAVARGKAGVNYSVVEHGQLLGLLSFRADTTYQQGLNRHWSVRTRYDYYEPMAANLGEQATLNKELVFNSTAPGGNDGVSSYQERWAEYRYKPSYVTGAFRSNATASLDSWHLALELAADTEMADLIPENPPIERIVAVPSEPKFIVDMWTRFRHARVMPIYSTPGLTRL